MPDWLGPLYQSANRLAHVYWLREKAHRDAWLIHLCFVNDPIRPTGNQQWTKELPAIDAELGLSANPPWHAYVIVDAREERRIP